MKKLITALMLTLALLTSCGSKTASDTQQRTLSSLTKTNSSLRADTSAQTRKNKELAADIASLKKKRDHYNQTTAAANKHNQTRATPTKPATSTANLAAKTYTGQQELTVNGNNPGFSAAQLSTAKGAWEQYHDLDSLNRAVDANALLNHALMPTAKREPLTWDPTGWHNRRTAHGWLYNRSHLIGFQLSGENNNPKNLITGTMSLNNPLMLAHEMDIAYYLKASNRHYVRYEVRPFYRGNELVARGVQMRAQSIGDNTIHFNVYIFNVEAGYTINYATGTSTTN